MLRANEAFYAAHEAADIDALVACWEHSDRIMCTHPGWPMLRGIDAVFDSYSAIFSGPNRNQFVLTDQVVEIVGDVAWVTLDENLLEVAATVATTNVFVRRADRWDLVVHHGSPVMGR